MATCRSPGTLDSSRPDGRSKPGRRRQEYATVLVLCWRAAPRTSPIERTCLTSISGNGASGTWPRSSDSAAILEQAPPKGGVGGESGPTGQMVRKAVLEVSDGFSIVDYHEVGL